MKYKFYSDEYMFPLISDHIVEGYPEDYSWVIDYLRHRFFYEEESSDLPNALLSKWSQPCDEKADKFRGTLLGLAVGDAIGTTNEFNESGTFPPIDDMVGGGPFNLNRGDWTDDTSMAYALGQSLILRNKFDADDQMDKYLTWYKHGAFSSTGKCFDIGNTVCNALELYERTGNPYSGKTSPETAGNGSLMRLAPIPLFFYNDLDKILYYAAESSKLTHAASEAVVSCQLYAYLIFMALEGNKKNEILDMSRIPGSLFQIIENEHRVLDIVKGSYRTKIRSEIKPSGYVIHSMEAALWCFYNSDSYKEGVLLAANMGGDADTIAAIYGQLAGAYYGERALPAEWVMDLTRQYIFFIQAQKMLEHAGLV